MLTKKTILAMMLLTACISMTTTSYADTIQTKINNIIESKKNNDKLLVLSEEDGAVYFVRNSDFELVKKINNAIKKNYWVQIDTNDRYIKSIKLIKNNKKSTYESYEKEIYDVDFTPTVISENKALQLFKEQSTDSKKKSQCYQRAHVWSFNMWQKHDVKNLKIFIFFTKKYISEYEYKWWFHVAPMVATDAGERVMDRSFSRKPLSVNTWASIFMKNKATCPTVEHYNDYEQNQNSESCYIRKVSMYYFQPIDIKNSDNGGYKKIDWLKWELKRANRGFKNWFFDPILDYGDHFENED